MHHGNFISMTGALLFTLRKHLNSGGNLPSSLTSCFSAVFLFDFHSFLLLEFFFPFWTLQLFNTASQFQSWGKCYVMESGFICYYYIFPLTAASYIGMGKEGGSWLVIFCLSVLWARFPFWSAFYSALLLCFLTMDGEPFLRDQSITGRRSWSLWRKLSWVRFRSVTL